MVRFILLQRTGYVDWMRHKKLYNIYGIGVGLFCGRKKIAGNLWRDVNFQISNCPKCGMEVTTIGHSPETNEAQEYQRDFNGFNP